MMAYMLLAVEIFKKKVSKNGESIILTVHHLNKAETLWVKEIQSHLIKHQQFGLKEAIESLFRP